MPNFGTPSSDAIDGRCNPIMADTLLKLDPVLDVFGSVGELDHCGYNDKASILSREITPELQKFEYESPSPPNHFLYEGAYTSTPDADPSFDIASPSSVSAYGPADGCSDPCSNKPSSNLSDMTFHHRPPSYHSDPPLQDSSTPRTGTARSVSAEPSRQNDERRKRQNRASQQAFRQRKQTHVETLERTLRLYRSDNQRLRRAHALSEAKVDHLRELYEAVEHMSRTSRTSSGGPLQSRSFHIPQVDVGLPIPTADLDSTPPPFLAFPAAGNHVHCWPVDMNMEPLFPSSFDPSLGGILGADMQSSSGRAELCAGSSWPNSPPMSASGHISTPASLMNASYGPSKFESLPSAMPVFEPNWSSIQFASMMTPPDMTDEIWRDISREASATYVAQGADMQGEIEPLLSG